MKTEDRLIDLVKKVKAGDNTAFTELYNESYKYLHTCVINIVKDEYVAQDMIQEAYIEIHKNLGQLKEDAGFLAWASTIANRKCFAYIKKNRDILIEEQIDDEGNESDFFESIADDEAFIPENIFDDREKINIIRGIIDDLTDIQRACVIGYYYNEQKQDEIAKELGIPVNTVKSHLNRSKMKIKQAVNDVEDKQGIKLYSFAPFMLLFFLKETEAYAAEYVAPGMREALISEVAGRNNTSAEIAKEAGSRFKEAIGSKASGIAIKTKVIAGIIAGAVVVGGVAGVTLHKGKPAESEVIEDEFVKNEKSGIIDISINQREMIDAISVYGMQLSSSTPTQFIEYMESVKSEYENGSNVQIDEGIDNGRANIPMSMYDGPLTGKNIGRAISFLDNDTDRIFAYKEFSEGISKSEYESTYERHYTVTDISSSESFVPGHEDCSIIISNIESIAIYGSENIINWINDGEGKNTVYVYDSVEMNTELKDYPGTVVSVDNCVVNANKGKTLATFLNEIHDDLYQLVNENEEVVFNNGSMKLDVGECEEKTLVITFDDSSQNGYIFNKIIFYMDSEDIINGTDYLGENGASGFYSIGDRMDMSVSEGQEAIPEKQADESNGMQSESRTDSKGGNEQGKVMSGEIDVDPLLGRADTMGWTKVKDVTDIVSWGSAVYSASGKPLEIVCLDSSGELIGIFETTRYILGKGSGLLDCFYNGTEYEGCNFKVVVYSALDYGAENALAVQFYPVIVNCTLDSGQLKVEQTLFY